jgi:hypothetical protein
MSTTDPVREIEPDAEILPSLTLPRCALHPSKEQADHDTEGQANTITPVEQFIRVLLLKHGPRTAVSKIEAYTQDKWESEAAHFRGDDHWTAWQNKVGVYVTGQLDELKDAEEKIRTSRKQWLLDKIPSEVERHIGKAEDIRNSVHRNTEYGYEGKIVTPAGKSPGDHTPTGVPEAEAIQENQLDNHVMPSDIGIELPAPLVVGTFPSSSGGDSTYALVPYCGTVVCGGPYFHVNSWPILCKHMVYFLLEAYTDDSAPVGLLPLANGVDVPNRARQLVAPQALQRYRPGDY